MGPSQTEPKPYAEGREDCPCWREILSNAFTGLYPTDQNLEKFLDRLERTP